MRIIKGLVVRREPRGLVARSGDERRQREGRREGERRSGMGGRINNYFITLLCARVRAPSTHPIYYAITYVSDSESARQRRFSLRLKIL